MYLRQNTRCSLLQTSVVVLWGDPFCQWLDSEGGWESRKKIFGLLIDDVIIQLPLDKASKLLDRMKPLCCTKHIKMNDLMKVYGKLHFTSITLLSSKGLLGQLDVIIFGCPASNISSQYSVSFYTSSFGITWNGINPNITVISQQRPYWNGVKGNLTNVLPYCALEDKRIPLLLQFLPTEIILVIKLPAGERLSFTLAKIWHWFIGQVNADLSWNIKHWIKFIIVKQAMQRTCRMH